MGDKIDIVPCQEPTVNVNDIIASLEMCAQVAHPEIPCAVVIV